MTLSVWEGIFSFTLVRDGEVIASGSFHNQAHNYFLGSMQLLALKGPTTICTTAPTTFHLVPCNVNWGTQNFTTYGTETYAYDPILEMPRAIASLGSTAEFVMSSISTPDGPASGKTFQDYGRAWSPNAPSGGLVTGASGSWTVSHTQLDVYPEIWISGIAVVSELRTPFGSNSRLMATGVFSWVSITTTNTVIVQPMALQHGDTLNVSYSFKIT